MLFYADIPKTDRRLVQVQSTTSPFYIFSSRRVSNWYLLGYQLNIFIANSRTQKCKYLRVWEIFCFSLQSISCSWYWHCHDYPGGLHIHSCWCLVVCCNRICQEGETYAVYCGRFTSHILDSITHLGSGMILDCCESHCWKKS